MLNRIIVMGRLTKDPELRDANGTPVCTIRIACDRDYKSQNGERETDFFDVVAWRGVAETVSKYFTKGRMIVVDGRLQIRPWTDRENVKRYATEIVADSVYFGDSKPQDGNGQGGQQNGYGSAPAGNGYGGGNNRGGQNNGYGGNGRGGQTNGYSGNSRNGQNNGYGGAPGYGNAPDNFDPFAAG
ncbi:MAG: single-stranded DNA-binding protein [Oscillibacter sp.]|nr:single-stranded DNA-binding protein [Oscillibacter sp.]